MGKGRQTASTTAQNFAGRQADGSPADIEAKYAKGMDVGHGVDHDCPQCRNARKNLEAGGYDIAAPSDGASEMSNVEAMHAAARAAGDPIIGDPNDRPDAIITSDNPADLIDAALSEPSDIAGIDDQNSAQVDKLVEHNRFKTALSRIMHDLNRALLSAWKARGIYGGIEVYIAEGEDAIAIVDAFIAAQPGNVAVMIMQGYVPNDARWHVEIMLAANRVHIKFLDRDVAIKLALLSILDGAKGLEFEKALAGFSKPEAIPYFTGTQQATKVV